MKRLTIAAVLLCFASSAVGLAPAQADTTFGQGQAVFPSDPGGACQPLVFVFTMRPTTIGWEFVVTDELVRPLELSPICYRLSPAVLYGIGSPWTGFTGQVRSGPFQFPSIDGSFKVDSITFDKPGFIHVTGAASGRMVMETYTP